MTPEFLVYNYFIKFMKNKFYNKLQDRKKFPKKQMIHISKTNAVQINFEIE